MEEKNRRAASAQDSDAMRRKREYFEACKRLRSRCFLTYVKIMEQRQIKKQYRSAFLETPGILFTLQQLFGMETGDMAAMDAKELMAQKAYLEVSYGRLFDDLEDLKKKPKQQPMSGRQYAYNLNLDWNRLDSAGKKGLKRRLANLLSQEEDRFIREAGEEEFLLLKELETQLKGLGEETVAGSVRKMEEKNCKEVVARVNNSLREAFGKAGLRFISYEEADEAQKEQWFHPFGAGENGPAPCIVWEHEGDKATLLLYGRYCL